MDWKRWNYAITQKQDTSVTMSKLFLDMTRKILNYEKLLISCEEVMTVTRHVTRSHIKCTEKNTHIKDCKIVTVISSGTTNPRNDSNDQKNNQLSPFLQETYCFTFAGNTCVQIAVLILLKSILQLPKAY